MSGPHLGDPGPQVFHMGSGLRLVQFHQRLMRCILFIAA
jgi:hypothetical protein